jgi:hypothetical protein
VYRHTRGDNCPHAVSSRQSLPADLDENEEMGANKFERIVRKFGK